LRKKTNSGSAKEKTPKKEEKANAEEEIKETDQ